MTYSLGHTRLSYSENIFPNQGKNIPHDIPTHPGCSRTPIQGHILHTQDTLLWTHTHQSQVILLRLYTRAKTYSSRHIHRIQDILPRTHTPTPGHPPPKNLEHTNTLSKDEGIRHSMKFREILRQPRVLTVASADGSSPAWHLIASLTKEGSSLYGMLARSR